MAGEKLGSHNIGRKVGACGLFIIFCGWGYELVSMNGLIIYRANIPCVLASVAVLIVSV